MQSLCLPQFEDLAVVESVHFALEELQGGRLTGQRPGDLLPHHLHHLRIKTHRWRDVYAHLHVKYPCAHKNMCWVKMLGLC